MKLKKLKKYRKIFYLIVIILIVIIFAAVHNSYKNTICANIKVVVTDSNKANFITKNQIIKFLVKNNNYNIIGNRFKNINLADIETSLNKIFFIKNAEVFRNNNDVLEIHITQRKPIVRIFDIKHFSYYIDNDGNFIPLSKSYTAYVPVAMGEIPHCDSLFNKNIKNINNKNINKIFKNLFFLVKKLKNNEFTNALLDEIIVNKDNEFEIVPKIGKYKIIIGNTDNLDEKIRNLKAFYSQAAPKTDWNRYSTINIKYQNQIVCTKK
jgi:cell division protein FtsQ